MALGSSPPTSPRPQLEHCSAWPLTFPHHSSPSPFPLPLNPFLPTNLHRTLPLSLIKVACMSMSGLDGQLPVTPPLEKVSPLPQQAWLASRPSRMRWASWVPPNFYFLPLIYVSYTSVLFSSSHHSLFLIILTLMYPRTLKFIPLI